MRFALAALLLTAATNDTSAQAPTSQEAAIRAQYAAVGAAINKRDAGAVASFFTVDGDEIFFDQARHTGRDVIRANAQQAYAGWTTTQRFTLTVTSIRMLGPDVALVESLATFSEGEIKSNRGTAVMVRQNGRWLIAALRVYAAAAGS